MFVIRDSRRLTLVVGFCVLLLSLEYLVVVCHRMEMEDNLNITEGWLLWFVATLKILSFVLMNSM